MKKIFLILSMALLFAAACNKTNNPQLNQNSSQTSQANSDPTHWQAYTDSASGFSFKYPQAWVVVKNNSAGSICIAEKTTPESCIIKGNILVAAAGEYEEKSASNEHMKKAFEEKYSKELINKNQQIVNGLHTLTYSVSEETQVYVENSKFDINFETTNSDKDVLNIFNEMVKSFQLML